LPFPRCFVGSCSMPRSTKLRCSTCTACCSCSKAISRFKISAVMLRHSFTICAPVALSSSSRVLAFSSPFSIRLVVISKWAWWLRGSPPSGAVWIAQSTATPCLATKYPATRLTARCRASGDSSTGKLNIHSLAVRLFLRFSFASQAPQRRCRDKTGFPSGKTINALTTPLRRL